MNDSESLFCAQLYVSISSVWTSHGHDMRSSQDLPVMPINRSCRLYIMYQPGTYFNIEERSPLPRTKRCTHVIYRNHFRMLATPVVTRN